MREFIVSNFEHGLFALILVSRLGDIGTTYLITPKLKLEANPIARKLGWWFGALTVLVCIVPYYSTALGVAVLVPSLLISSSNTAKIWFVRAYGESEYYELLHRLARTSKFSHAITGTILSALFIALAGLVLLFFYPDPIHDWGYWVAMGFLIYSVVIGLYGCLYFARLFKSARRGGDQKTPVP